MAVSTQPLFLQRLSAESTIREGVSISEACPLGYFRLIMDASHSQKTTFLSPTGFTMMDGAAAHFFVHSLLRAHDWQHRPQFDDVCYWWRCGGRGVLALVGMTHLVLTGLVGGQLTNISSFSLSYGREHYSVARNVSR